MNPNAAAELITDLGQKWTSAEQKQFMDELGRTDWAGAYLNTYHQAGYDEGYDDGCRDSTHDEDDE